ncbi:ATPase inhibitor [Penicillium macrosclerotiorum]|uniref:ATPase inhibitor n=1 Tax=Penicillium macrosclerotiorum TaxID=303699 RepID=UPI002549536F|nr:ATPase inhibitor [Penicillium macrosclerotiorum]KAJ5676143.1 ATPase inhibitor [Penicillium macrosclerotiorum]
MQSAALTRSFFRTAPASLILSRQLSTTPITMAAGDTGAPKPRGFLAEKDQFQRREAAQEAMYIRQQEMDKIERLRLKMKESRKHMEELDKHLEELAKTQGGEQN